MCHGDHCNALATFGGHADGGTFPAVTAVVMKTEDDVALLANQYFAVGGAADAGLVGDEDGIFVKARFEAVIIVFHVFTHFGFGQLSDDLEVAADGDRGDGGQVAAINSECRVSPAETNGVEIAILDGEHVGHAVGAAEVFIVLRNDVACEAVQHVEGVFGGVERADGAPSIVATAPAPIKMEVVVLVVAVANKGVTALPVVVGAAVIERNTLIQAALFQHVGPLGVVVLPVVGDVVVAGVAEIVAQRRRHIIRVGTTAAATVLHVDGDAEMV